MTSSSVSNQGFTVHNHRCGINFLSHLRGAPQKPTPTWDDQGRGRVGAPSAPDRVIAGIAVIETRSFTTKDTKEHKGGEKPHRRGRRRHTSIEHTTGAAATG
jgi:hypothetical protein